MAIDYENLPRIAVTSRPKYDQRRLIMSGLALFVTYFAAAELGRTLSFPGNIASFWPPSGIYIAALLLTPIRLWPGIAAIAWAAAALSNVGLHERTLLASTGFWIGNSTDSILAAALIRRFLGDEQFALGRLPDLLLLSSIGALFTPPVGALIGAATVYWIYQGPFWEVWRVWWMASGIGVLIVSPVVLSLADRRLDLKSTKGNLLEALCAFFLLIFILLVAPGSTELAAAYAVFPMMLWIALRFMVRGVALACFTIAIITVWQTAHGRGQFAQGTDVPSRVLMIQTFLCVTSVSFLTTATALFERRRSYETAQRNEARYQTLFENMTDLMLTVAPDGHMLHANRAWRTATGYAPEEISKLTVREIVASSDRGRFQGAINSLARSDEPRPIETRILTKSGKALDVEGSCQIYFEDGQATWICAIFRDVTRRKQEQREVVEYQRHLEDTNAALRSLSITDPLTRLYNRRFFQQKMEEELAQSHQQGLQLSVLLIDVDHFKSFNDTFGHLAGDAVLGKVAQLLQENARNSDIVARYGGEEFSVLLPGTDLKTACMLGDRLRQAIEDGPWLGQTVTVSIGAASRKNSSMSAEELVHLADDALYASKQSGRNLVTGMDALGHPVLLSTWTRPVEKPLIGGRERHSESVIRSPANPIV